MNRRETQDELHRDGTLTQRKSGATSPEQLSGFFAALEEKLADQQEANRRQSQDLLNRLEPRLNAAREIDRELNRQLAHRFNVFRYLRDDELGLSRIIADLLNPAAPHGQGPLFLRILLNSLGLGSRWLDTALSGAKVAVERLIEGQRRIDIYVEASAGGRRYGLAIENKPYAGDQEAQANDYLKHLKCQFGKAGDQFHLIYLSPSGEPPSEASLPKATLDKWRDHLLVMAYHRRDTSDGDGDQFSEVQAPCSLTEWLAACRAQCEAERLRWFLGDAESFCRNTFGDADMASDVEVKTVRELLESEPRHFETARAVYEAWPQIRDAICQRFLERLCCRIKAKMDKKEVADDTQVTSHYGGERGYRNYVRIHRSSWRKNGDQGSDAVARTHIELVADGAGPFDWLYGVRTTHQRSEHQFETLKKALKRAFPHHRSEAGWPIWDWVKRDGINRDDWSRTLMELHQECGVESKRGGGEVSDYYVETLVNFAKTVIPIIDAVEGVQSSQG